MSSPDDALVTAWQEALAAEQQAAFGYALLGPHLPGSRQDLARSCQALHEDLRDRTADAIAAFGAAPVAAQGDYPALYGVAPLALTARLEDGCAVAWRYFYAELAAGTAHADLRAAAQSGLTGSAVRATRWRIAAGGAAAVVAFPGTATP